MTENLIPCPCCGARQTDEDEPLGLWWTIADDTWQVFCDRCRQHTTSFHEKEDAVAAWNKGETK